MTGCTNPSAVNYNPASDEDDGSCIYLNKIADTCYSFQAIDQTLVEDKSFTLSYSIEGNAWVFYHDYIPDFYFSTRQQLYNIKNNKIWSHNLGEPGKFHKDVKNSFFVDVVFAFDSEILLNSVQWVTQVVNTLGKVQNFKTFTHITIWNDSQCSGKLAIKELLPLETQGVSKSKSEFSFNAFSDIVKSHTEFFMQSVFNNIEPDSSTIDADLPWYEQGYFQHKYFVIRFEMDNTSGDNIYIQSTNITGQETYK